MLSKELITDDEYVRYKICGDQLYLYTSSVTSPGNFITKLSSTEYLVNGTREIRRFRESEKGYKDIQLLYKSLNEVKHMLEKYAVDRHKCVGITLTYADTMRDFSKSGRHFNKFIEKLRTNYGSLEYIAVVELQKRGVIHYHSVIVFPTHAPYINALFLQTLWNYGNVYVEKVKSNKQVAYYFTKYNLDLKESVALELFPNDIDDYLTYKELNENAKMETYVQDIAIRLLPRNLQVYRHSNGIKKIKTLSGTKGDVLADVESGTLDAAYTRTKVDDFTGEVINTIRCERYTIKKKGGVENGKKNTEL